jgi:hypothetical protein
MDRSDEGPGTLTDEELDRWVKASRCKAARAPG